MNTTCISVLNYNNAPATVRCISSVLKQTLQDWHLVIIDNCSTDDSVSVIKAFLERNNLTIRISSPVEGPKVIPDVPGKIFLLLSDRNGGYSYGNNLGIRLAKSLQRTGYLLIINNDVVLKENFLEETIKHYEELRIKYKTEKIALGATETGENGSVHHKGFHYIHLPTGITFFSPVFPSFKYIVGSCIFTDAGAPLMDESFFLYFDDVQYSGILRSNGYILETGPGSFYIHEPVRTGDNEIRGVIFKSLRRFYRLNYPLLLLVVVPVRLLLNTYLWIKSIF